MDRDLWVITFDHDDELFLLNKQIESLIYYENKLDYNIITNCTDHNKILEKMSDLGILGSLESAPFNYNIFSQTDFLSEKEINDQGYINQQLLKTQVYKKSNTNTHIILDCKNIILDSEILENLGPKVLLTRPHVFLGCYEYFTRLWHKGKQLPLRGASTPFIFEKSLLIELENYFESRQDFIKHFKRKYSITKKSTFKIMNEQNIPIRSVANCISEFYMYSLFEQKIRKNVSNTLDNNPRVLFQNSRKIDENLSYSKYNILAFHRKIVKKLGQEKSNQLIDYFLYKKWS